MNNVDKIVTKITDAMKEFSSTNGYAVGSVYLGGKYFKSDIINKLKHETSTWLDFQIIKVDNNLYWIGVGDKPLEITIDDL